MRKSKQSKIIGRPKLPPADVRGKRVTSWLTSSDHALVDQATKAAGEVSVSRWSSLVIVRAARNVLSACGVSTS
jgi:hypothetical protein